MRGFKNVKVYVEGMGVIKTDIGFENGNIAAIGNDLELEEIAKLGEDACLVPGFIDEHIHGAAKCDTMDATKEALETIAKALVKEGTTGFLATTMTQSPENITNALKNVKEFVGVLRPNEAEVLGVHLEGPFISPDYIGAQPLEYVAQPSIETFKTYQEVSGNNIKIVTIAPEVEGALTLIEYLDKTGVVASVGHTAAKYEDVHQAVLNGATNVTHTYNAQRPIHHREIGTVGAAFIFDELYCELICDLIHLSAPAIK